MRIQEMVCAGVLAVGMAASSLAQQPGFITGDPAKGAALLADARKALGGEDKLAAILLTPDLSKRLESDTILNFMPFSLALQTYRETIAVEA